MPYRTAPPPPPPRRPSWGQRVLCSLGLHSWESLFPDGRPFGDQEPLESHDPLRFFRGEEVFWWHRCCRCRAIQVQNYPGAILGKPPIEPRPEEIPRPLYDGAVRWRPY